jgi:LCP family protein required for cell wall assembly
MPKDKFKAPRGRAVDGFISNFSAGEVPHAGHRLAPQPYNNSPRRGRLIGDFSLPEGYHPARRPLMSPHAAPTPASDTTEQPALEHTALTHEPLLGSKAAKEQLKVPKERFGRRLRRWTRRTALVLLAILLVGGGLLFGKGYLKLHEIFKGGGKAVALQANVDPSQLNGEGDGRINILLLGIGGQGHDGPDLTDTMLVASLDPVNNKADLLSVPRDLWIKEPDNYMGQYQKINAAYEAGKYDYLNEENPSNSNQNAIDAGFKTADEAVSGVLGIPIDYNVLVDFQAFQQAVNTVGGVTVNVPTELYDPTIAWQNNGNPIIAEPGLQTMNGNQALLYVRSRETSSDFARTQRQRSVLVPLKDKALTLGTLSNPFKISSLLSAFGNNVRTDISLSDAEALYSLMKKVSNNNIDSVGLADPPNNFVTTADVDSLSVVEPTAGEFNYSQIQSYVRNTLRDGYLAKENANVMVLNGTDVTDAATNVAATLKSYGYNVGTVGDAPTQNYSKTVIVDLTNGKDKYTAHYLEQRYGVSTVNSLPDSSIQPNGAQFVIIVGEHEATSSSQN